MNTDNQTQNIAQNQFDFTSIDEMDPSLDGGYRLLYDRQISFNIKFQEKTNEIKDLPNQEVLKVRIFILGTDENPQQLKIELSSDNDLFFYFFHLIDEQSYDSIKQTQQLIGKFKDYPSICIKCFNKCEKENEQYSAIFTILSDGEGKLELKQTTEYKNIDIITFDFQAMPEEITKKLITYRYMSCKQKLAIQEGRLADINDIIKLKNPQLLLQIQKTLPYPVNKSVMKK